MYHMITNGLPFTKMQKILTSMNMQNLNLESAFWSTTKEVVCERIISLKDSSIYRWSALAAEQFI